MAKNKKREFLREPTGIILPGGRKVIAHITGSVKSKTAGKVYVRWELWDKRTCIMRAPREKVHKYNPSTESWEHCVRLLVAKAEDAFRQEYKGESGSTTASIGAGVEGIFINALNSLDDSEIALLRKSTWGTSTWKNYFSAFRTLCIDLDTLEEYTPDTLKKMREVRIERAAKSKNSKGKRKATENVDKMLLALIYSLDSLRMIVNEREGRNVLPEVALYDVIAPSRRYQFEQIKWVPMPVVSRLVARLFARIDRGVCMGIAAMLLFGVRTGECVAILLGELDLIDECMVRYKVCHQGPERSSILKTNNAYRIVLAGKLLYDLVVARMAYLRALGYTDEEIRIMPLVGRDDDPKKPVKGDKLSEVARQILLEAGYSMCDMILASQLMVLEPDYEADGSLMRSVSAYIFRRHYATMICNCCDLFPASGVEDYFLGHARKKALPFDIKNQDVQREMVRKMERLVYSPEHTENPLYQATALSSAEGKWVCDLNEYSAYTFTAESEVEIKIILHSREPNGRLYFDTDVARNRRKIMRQDGKKDTLESRANRPITPLPLFPEEFKKILADEKSSEEAATVEPG